MKTKIYLPLASKLIALACSAMFICYNASAQNTFPSTGRAGIYTTSPASSLQVKGGVRIGTLSNYVNIDSATGNFSFVGTSGYQVGGNKYAFQYSGNPNYGLFFNSSAVQYEFRNGSAVPVFSINANTGNSVLNGTLKVGAYTLPATDGTSGQVLKTNGAGVLAWNADNSTSYTAGTGISISGTTITNTAPNQPVSLTGGGATTVTGTYPNFTVSSTDNNTIYTAGTGISISGTTITNAAPDKTVALTAGTGISVTGTYPSFTITNTGTGSGSGWSLTGNAGTDSSINFLGTTDAHPLVFRVGNVKSGIIDSTYNITSLGYESLLKNTTGTYNTAFGAYSLNINTSGLGNTGSGYEALYQNTTGNYNTADGMSALTFNSSGTNNTATGYQALYSNTTGTRNVAIGDNSMNQNQGGGYNTALGSSSLYANTIGGDNTAIGLDALESNINASDNTALGVGSLGSNTYGYQNTAEGSRSLQANTSGNENTANGYGALYSNTTGNNNTAAGYYSLYLNTTGYSNVAIGTAALHNSTNAHNFVAIGDSALYNQSAIVGGEFPNLGYSTAIGSKSLYSNTTGLFNTATGFQSLYSNTTGETNTANGYLALYYNTTGNSNTAAGPYSLYSNTTGYSNAAYGLQSLQSNTSGIGNSALGVGADVNAENLQNATAIGYFATATSSNQVMLGSTSITSVEAAGGFVIYSDGRFKKNIKYNTHGLDFINQLKPVTYNYDIHKLNAYIAPEKSKKETLNAKEKSDIEAGIKNKESILYSGFIAQDVETAAKKIGYDFSGIHKPQNDKDPYGLSYSDFVVPLVKAVQELSTQNDSLKNENASLRNDLNDLKALVLSIQQKQEQCSPCSAIISSDAMQAQSFTTVLTDNASLQQNVPNPFGNTTLIGYTLPQKFTAAQIIIIDKNGKTLKAVTVSGSGKGSLNVDASLLAAGAYQYSLLVDGRLIGTRQMVLAK